MSELLFGLLAAVILGCAVMFVFNRNIVHSVVWFFGCLLGIAGIYLVLDAPFLAALQVLIYGGAITVLILFVVMLTMSSQEVRIPGASMPAVAAAGALVFFVIMVAALGGNWAAPQALKGKVPGIADLAAILFTKYLLPFELASIVLLAALIGAIYIARGESE